MHASHVENRRVMLSIEPLAHNFSLQGRGECYPCSQKSSSLLVIKRSGSELTNVRTSSLDRTPAMGFAGASKAGRIRSWLSTRRNSCTVATKLGLLAGCDLAWVQDRTPESGQNEPGAVRQTGRSVSTSAEGHDTSRGVHGNLVRDRHG